MHAYASSFIVFLVDNSNSSVITRILLVILEKYVKVCFVHWLQHVAQWAQHLNVKTLNIWVIKGASELRSPSVSSFLSLLFAYSRYITLFVLAYMAYTNYKKLHNCIQSFKILDFCWYFQHIVGAISIYCFQLTTKNIRSVLMFNQHISMPYCL